MNYSGLYVNQTMKRDTAHVFHSVFGCPGVFLWECESPLRWELGNLLTLVLCSSQSEKKWELGWLWTRCCNSKHARTDIVGGWGRGGAKIPRQGWVGAVVTSLHSQTAWSGFSMQTHEHSHGGVHTQTPKWRKKREITKQDIKRCQIFHNP